MKRYKDEEWLREQYREKNRLQSNIAKECGVHQTTISDWINKFGIKKKTKEIIAREDPLTWSKNVAYLSGLITSDGNLSKDQPIVKFFSKDYSLIKQAKQIVENKLDINQCTPSQQNDGVWQYRFVSRRFYYFLEDIGLMPNKSLKLGGLNVPDKYFLPWLRGEIDGDGSFYMKGNYLQLSITSGSSAFLKWVSQELRGHEFVDGKGKVNKNNASYRLMFGDKDSKSIANAIYKDANHYLRRKYNIVKEFI